MHSLLNAFIAEECSNDILSHIQRSIVKILHFQRKTLKNKQNK